jgi:hypothetical protein
MRPTDATPSSTLRTPDSSTTIIQSIKEEISKSQNIVLERLIQLEQKCEVATQQYLTSQHFIQTEIMPSLESMSDLIVNVYDTLIAKHILPLTEQQQTKLSHIRQMSTTSRNQLFPPLTPLLSRTRAHSNLRLSLTSISNQPQLSSIPSESNLDENFLVSNNSVQ